MTDKEEKELIERVTRPNYVHAAAPNARSAFLSGAVLFDVRTQDGKRLEAFFRQNPDLKADAAVSVKHNGWWAETQLPEPGSPRVLLTVHRPSWGEVRLRSELADY